MKVKKKSEKGQHDHGPSNSDLLLQTTSTSSGSKIMKDRKKNKKKRKREKMKLQQLGLGSKTKVEFENEEFEFRNGDDDGPRLSLNLWMADDDEDEEPESVDLIEVDNVTETVTEKKSKKRKKKQKGDGGQVLKLQRTEDDEGCNIGEEDSGAALIETAEVESVQDEKEMDVGVSDEEMDYSVISPSPLQDKKSSPRSRTKKRKEKSVPKIRRSAVNEDIEDNYMLVPWADSDEWNGICLQLRSGNYSEVVQRIAVWQRRVSSLPVGVEATMFLLEALMYDQKLRQGTPNLEKGPLYTEDQSRALYSLAIIRFLNHVNHFAAQSLGETSTRPSEELVAMVDAPDWLVTLRNEVSHGLRAPSLEVLRVGGNCVLQWLKDRYWKLPDDQEAASENDPFTIVANNDNVDIPQTISQLLAAYVAAKIYKKRHQNLITDPNIICHVPSPSVSVPVKTKVAVAAIRKSLKSYLNNHPSLFCEVISQELIPSTEFYDSFTSIFQKKRKGNIDANDNEIEQEERIFNQYYLIWLPILKMLEAKGKLVPVLSKLCDIMTDRENDKIWEVVARWITKILEMFEDSGTKYSKKLVGILKDLLKKSNSHMHMFLERFFSLTEPIIGAEAIGQLQTLMNVWLDTERSEKEGKKRKSVPAPPGKFFSLSDIGIGSSDCDSTVINGSGIEGTRETDVCVPINPWTEDPRGAKFWQNIPLGSVI